MSFTLLTKKRPFYCINLKETCRVPHQTALDSSFSILIRHNLSLLISIVSKQQIDQCRYIGNGNAASAIDVSCSQVNQRVVVA